MSDSAARTATVEKRRFLCSLSLSFVMFVLVLRPLASHGGDPIVIEGSEWTTSGVLKEKVKKFGKDQSSITVDIIFGPQGAQSTLAASEELAVPACGFDAVGEIEVDVHSMKLKATPRSKKGVESIRLTLKAKFDVIAEAEGTATQIPVTWSYKGRGGRR